MTAHKLQVAQEMYRSGQYTVAAIATTLGVRRASIYRHLTRPGSAAEPGGGGTCRPPPAGPTGCGQRSPWVRDPQTGRQLSRCRPRTCVRYTGRVGTWHDPDLGQPIAAPLERCAQLLGAELATVRALAATVEPYLRADGTRIWSLCSLSANFDPRPTAGAAAATSTADRPRPPMQHQPGRPLASTVR
jgi:hypothetical protein